MNLVSLSKVKFEFLQFFLLLGSVRFLAKPGFWFGSLLVGSLGFFHISIYAGVVSVRSAVVLVVTPGVLSLLCQLCSGYNYYPTTVRLSFTKK